MFENIRNSCGALAKSVIHLLIIQCVTNTCVHANACHLRLMAFVRSLRMIVNYSRAIGPHASDGRESSISLGFIWFLGGSFGADALKDACAQEVVHMDQTDRLFVLNNKDAGDLAFIQKTEGF